MSAKISDLEFLSWQEGIDRIDNALGSLGIRSLSEDSAPVITSKDPIAKRMKETLSIKGLPDGFSKWQLPVYFEGEGAQFFITVAEPGVEADEHAHSNGAAMRFIVSGSIEYAGTELTQGDWMFIPKDTSYSFKAGDMGGSNVLLLPLLLRAEIAPNKANSLGLPKAAPLRYTTLGIR